MMDSCSSSDDPPLIAESFAFDETTFSVLPVISVDGQAIGLSDLERDPLESETLLSVPFCPTITYTTTVQHFDTTPVDILADSTEDAELIPVDSCKSSILDGDVDFEQEVEECVSEVEMKCEIEEPVEDSGGEEASKVPLVVMEESQAPSMFEAHVLQLDGGTLAYIHSQPQDGCQAVELEDGTVAYITLTQPLVLEPDPEPESLQVVDPDPDPDPPKKPKSFMCPHEGCGRLYTSAHHLKVHERTHTGIRPFNCTVEGCDKAFSTDYSRKAHVRTHTGEKPYKCTEHYCTKSFKTSGDLQKHVRTHTGERPFLCPVEGCNRSFTTSNIRKVHIRTHTGERPYVCTEPYCDKAFASATNYKNHIRIHSGEKPYCCNVVGCNKRFTEYSSLYKHHMVHTQEKPYQCGVCGRSYRQVSTLTVHKRTAHGVIEADDGTEIMLGNVFTQKVLKGTNVFANTKKLKNYKTVPSNLLGDTEYILDSSGSIQRISSEQIFIIEDIPEHLRALQHIQDPDDDELQAALDPLQEQ